MEWVYIIVALWALGMIWFLYEIMWKVRRIRLVRRLHKLSDKELKALYAEKWRKINKETIKDRKKRMEYVEVIYEMIRRNLYSK